MDIPLGWIPDGKGGYSKPGSKSANVSGDAWTGKESELHQKIEAECRRRRWLPFHGSTAHRAMRTIGEPDFTIAADGGRTFYIEVKTKTGKLSPEQTAVGHVLMALGQRYKVVHSFQEFVDFVDDSK